MKYRSRQRTKANGNTMTYERSLYTGFEGTTENYTTVFYLA